ncbi:MAG TPA: signal peptide peptidase SppA [Candidatus Acidoferrum sp.]|nr:signal peptide peptidase SppA [Candidatus Acidoferrum sp.]
MQTPPLPPNDAPPPLTPPPVITPPPPVKPRKSRGWMIASIVLSVLLVFCVLIIFAQFVSRAFSTSLSSSLRSGFRPSYVRDVGPRLEECLVEDNGSRRKIAVITVDGIITSEAVDPAGNTMVDIIKAQFDRAKDDDRVKAVILKVDSPGGEVLASDQISKLVADFQTDDPPEVGRDVRHGKPVVCSMGSLAASGGYYISAPSRWIVANELTITGSIGVIMHTWNYRSLMDKVGLAPVTYKSGKFKDMLSGDRSTNEIPPEEHAMVQGLIDETYQKFKSVVADGRAAAHKLNATNGCALAPDWAKYADGRVLSGKQALQYGFVDELGDFDKAAARARKIAHISSANLIEYRERHDISEFLRLFGQNSAAPHDLKLNLGLEGPKLQAGQLYFLSSTLVN